MFLEDEELLTMVIYYKKSGRHYSVYNEAKFNESPFTDDEKGEYQKLTIKARPLTWGLYNELQESAMVEDHLGNRKWNYKVYKENKLRNIIVKWDAQMKNEEGETVKAPVNAKTISKMSPDVAEVILNTYDQMTLIDEEEEKKS